MKNLLERSELATALLERSELATALLEAAMKAGLRSKSLGTDEEADVWEDMRTSLLELISTTEQEDRREGQEDRREGEPKP